MAGQRKTVIIYGLYAAREQAMRLLENHPAIRRVDASGDLSRISLLCNQILSEEELFLLLLDSGIDGYQNR